MKTNYKTAHEKLLELGLELSYDDKEYAEYFKPKAEMPKLVICISKTDKVYWLQSVYYKVDLQLSKILTQYLEELKDE